MEINKPQQKSRKPGSWTKAQKIINQRPPSALENNIENPRYFVIAKNGAFLQHAILVGNTLVIKPLIPILLLLALLTGCGKPAPPSVSLPDAARQGDLPSIRQHIKAGSNLNEKDLVTGSTPLITAATFGQTDVARALIHAGADLNVSNNDGSTALISAAFLCRTEIVRDLLQKGADKTAKNKAGSTALESVAGSFDQVKGVYDLLQAVLGPAGLKLDLDQIQATRPLIAEMLR